MQKMDPSPLASYFSLTAKIQFFLRCSVIPAHFNFNFIFIFNFIKIAIRKTSLCSCAKNSPRPTVTRTVNPEKVRGIVEVDFAGRKVAKSPSR